MTLSSRLSLVGKAMSFQKSLSLCIPLSVLALHEKDLPAAWSHVSKNWFAHSGNSQGILFTLKDGNPVFEFNIVLV